jgi:hypothetical protein
MTPTIVPGLSSRDAGSANTFADRLAVAIAASMVNRVSGSGRRERQPETLEQLIAAAISRELPR